MVISTAQPTSLSGCGASKSWRSEQRPQEPSVGAVGRRHDDIYSVSISHSDLLVTLSPFTLAGLQGQATLALLSGEHRPRPPRQAEHAVTTCWVGSDPHESFWLQSVLYVMVSLHFPKPRWFTWFLYFLNIHANRIVLCVKWKCQTIVLFDQWSVFAKCGMWAI